jgi:hypothetical protein
VTRDEYIMSPEWKAAKARGCYLIWYEPACDIWKDFLDGKNTGTERSDSGLGSIPALEPS